MAKLESWEFNMLFQSKGFKCGYELICIRVFWVIYVKIEVSKEYYICIFRSYCCKQMSQLVYEI